MLALMKCNSRFKAVFAPLCLLMAPWTAASGGPPSPIQAPIPLQQWNGWSNCCLLANGRLKLIVVPAVGRIMHLSADGSPNLLRAAPPPPTRTAWPNCGGEWIWPVTQERWKAVWGAEWPPPREVAGWDWDSRAKQAGDGTVYCTLRRRFPAPINVEVERVISLPHTGTTVIIRQKITRLAESRVPVAAWNLVQVARPDNLYLPTTSHSRFPQGFRVLMGRLPRELLHRHAEGLSFICRAAEFKVGTDSIQSWAAARKDNLLITLRQTAASAEGPWPDGGCHAEIYYNSGLGYAELETLTPEVLLKPGESLTAEIAVTVAFLGPSGPWTILDGLPGSH